MTANTIPALYVLDDTGEANGSVFYFCGAKCRDEFRRRVDELFAAGDSPDWITGTNCDNCGTVV